jgi:hypothetical protein
MALSAADGSDALAVLQTLETALGQVDALGAHLAGAHLDAAIQQLRLHIAESARHPQGL